MINGRLGAARPLRLGKCGFQPLLVLGVVRQELGKLRDDVPLIASREVPLQVAAVYRLDHRKVALRLDNPLVLDAHPPPVGPEERLVLILRVVLNGLVAHPGFQFLERLVRGVPGDDMVDVRIGHDLADLVIGEADVDRGDVRVFLPHLQGLGHVHADPLVPANAHVDVHPRRPEDLREVRFLRVRRLGETNVCGLGNLHHLSGDMFGFEIGAGVVPQGPLLDLGQEVFARLPVKFTVVPADAEDILLLHRRARLAPARHDVALRTGSRQSRRIRSGDDLPGHLGVVVLPEGLLQVVDGGIRTFALLAQNVGVYGPAILLVLIKETLLRVVLQERGFPVDLPLDLEGLLVDAGVLVLLPDHSFQDVPVRGGDHRDGPAAETVGHRPGGVPADDIALLVRLHAHCGTAGNAEEGILPRGLPVPLGQGVESAGLQALHEVRRRLRDVLPGEFQAVAVVRLEDRLLQGRLQGAAGKDTEGEVHREGRSRREFVLYRRGDGADNGLPGQGGHATGHNPGGNLLSRRLRHHAPGTGTGPTGHDRVHPRIFQTRLDIRQGLGGRHPLPHLIHRDDGLPLLLGHLLQGLAGLPIDGLGRGFADLGFGPLAGHGNVTGDRRHGLVHDLLQFRGDRVRPTVEVRAGDVVIDGPISPVPVDVDPGQVKVFKVWNGHTACPPCCSFLSPSRCPRAASGQWKSVPRGGSALRW
ncbi:MAG: hypothetical protein A4E73_00305 [Syntrophaceae bacterium PtaU1.Bin231]|nr:MAG: hypothetical protein A4E73_00305 [Syntrophaceae bacterium PtaU1.Bin231]